MKLLYTSAFVLLLLGKEIYQTAAAKAYLAQLDLSAGQDLYNEAIAFWQHFPQLIQQRKFAVLSFAELLHDADSLPQQVIIAGAGLDAMGLELSARYPNTHIYELDAAFEGRKRALIPDPRLDFIKGDLNDPDHCRSALAAHGWQPNEPSLLIYEGITYYLSAEALKGLTAGFSPRFVIADYLKPASLITAEAAAAADFVFGAILPDGKAPPPTRYTHETLADALGLPLHRRLGMDALERLYRGAPRTFADDTHGYVDLALFGK